MQGEEEFSNYEQESDELVENDAMDPEEEGFLAGLEHREDVEKEYAKLEELDEAAYQKAFQEASKKK